MVKHNVILIVLRWQVGEELFHFLAIITTISWMCQLITFPLFQFVMPRGEVERRTMWISVWHSDMFGRNDFLGEVMMPMAGQVFDDPAAKWYSLQDRVSLTTVTTITNSDNSSLISSRLSPLRTSLSSTPRVTSSSPSSTFPRSPH